MTDSTRRFSNRVDFYVRARPRYPSALLRFFQSDLCLSPADTVADIGAGTGFLTELFVHNGNVTYAVEPNDQMRSAAETYLGQFPNFRAVNGTAEATTLDTACVDLVAAAQAFHWFDPARAREEFLRILKPGGWVALVWNERRRHDSPFTQAYQDLLAKHRVDRTARSMRDLEADAAIETFFSPGGFEVKTFDNAQMLDRQGLMERMASSSYMPLPPDPRHDEVRRDAEQLFDRHQVDGTVRIAQETRVFFGRLQT